MNSKIIFLKETDSTNTRISQLAKDGAAEGTVVWADAQTAGKGRRGRSWESPAGKNLYFSILLRPELAPQKAPMLTLVMACAVARAVGEVLETMRALSFGSMQETERIEEQVVTIKWPNDLVLSGKKVCGILTEMHLLELSETEKIGIDYVVVGTGINVDLAEFPEELKEKATSLFLETGRSIDREFLLKGILKEFENLYQRFLEVQDLSFLREEYNQKLINREREVLVLEPGNEYKGKALGINSEGELLVETECGVQTVFAGEVSVRGIYGYV